MNRGQIKKQYNVNILVAEYLTKVKPSDNGMDYQKNQKTLKTLCDLNVEFERAKNCLDEIWGYKK